MSLHGRRIFFSKMAQTRLQFIGPHFLYFFYFLRSGRAETERERERERFQMEMNIFLIFYLAKVRESRNYTEYSLYAFLMLRNMCSNILTEAGSEESRGEIKWRRWEWVLRSQHFLIPLTIFPALAHFYFLQLCRACLILNFFCFLVFFLEIAEGGRRHRALKN